jgi:hypothetical protein
MLEMRMHKNFGEMPTGKRTLRRPRGRGKDHIRADLREILWDVVDWIHLAQESG